VTRVNNATITQRQFFDVQGEVFVLDL